MTVIAPRDPGSATTRSHAGSTRRRASEPTTRSTAARRVARAASRIVAVADHDDARAAAMAPIVDAVANAAEADTGLTTLIAELERPEVLQEHLQEDPLARARLRGIRAKQRLLNAEGGVVSGQEFADLVGVSRQAIDKRRRNGTLIGLSLGKKGYYYPVWQVDTEGLKPVLAELRHYGPWTQAAFMLTRNRWLGGETPLMMLRRGEHEAVLTAASMYGEQTASSVLTQLED